MPDIYKEFTHTLDRKIRDFALKHFDYDNTDGTDYFHMRMFNQAAEEQAYDLFIFRSNRENLALVVRIYYSYY